MASPIRNTYAAKTWHEITPGTKWTQFTHNSGSSSVVYTESAAEPADYDPSVPTNAKSKVGDNVYFRDVTDGDSIFFYPLNGDVSLTITVVEV